MSIKAFTSDPALTDAFVRLGYDLYRGDPNWIPPSEKELYAQLSPDFPFYQKPRNAHRHFVAEVRGACVGRLSAMINTDLHDADGTPVGTIGFFECVDDYGVAEDLLHAATQWLRDERDIRRIWGPMNFDIWHEYRFMTRGFDLKPFYGEPYNKQYYPAFFDHYGFTAKQQWESFDYGGREDLETILDHFAPRYRQFVEKGYHFVHFGKHGHGEDLRRLHIALAQSFSSFLGFTPLSFAEFEGLFTRFQYALHPRLFTFIYDGQDNLAGFAGAILDMSDGLRAMRGKDHLRARLRFLFHRRRAHRILFYLIGATPGNGARHAGLGSAAVYYIVREVLSAGYDCLMPALIACGARSRAWAGGSAVPAPRQYTLYEVNL